MSSDSPHRPCIVAAVVLYRTPAGKSVTLQTMQAALASSAELPEAIELMVWDNTPGERSRPEGFAGIFHHDASNPGLAAAYNGALQHAADRGAAWVLTLDQDTAVTADYLEEVVRTAARSQASVLLPRLIWQGRILSPFQPNLQGPPSPVENTPMGETTDRLQAFNSGAVLSVERMTALGGFDRNFPLDYLDHSTFARLHRSGASFHVLNATLVHELSSQATGRLGKEALQRERSVLAAERRFYRAFGTGEEQRMYPIRMLRRAAAVLYHKRDFAQALLIVKTLAGWNR